LNSTRRIGVALALCLALHATATLGADDPRRETLDLLVRARSAMKEGKLQTADSLVSRAEALQAEFGPLHFGDTPKKARRDLDALRRTQGKQADRPSQRFQPSASTDPKASKNAGSRPPGAARTPPADELGEDGLPTGKDNLPGLDRSEEASESAIDRSKPAELPLDPNLIDAKPARGDDIAPARSAEASDRGAADALLLEARRALAVGDVRRAAGMVEQAKATGAEFGLHDDSPAKVEMAIRKHNEVMELGKGRQNSDGWRRQYADLLLEQSQQLLRRKDFDEAERLATSAGRLNVAFNQFEVQPSTLLEKISAERKKAGQGGATTAAKTRPTGRPSPASPTTRRPNAPPLANPAATSDKAGVARSGSVPPLRYPGRQTIYQPQQDPTRNVTAAQTQDEASEADRPAAELDEPSSTRQPDDGQLERVPANSGQPLAAPPAGNALNLYRQGEQALRERSTEKALDLFRQAYALRDQLDEDSVQKLQDHLQSLSVPAAKSTDSNGSLLDSTAAKQQLLARQVSTEVANKQLAAKKLLEKEPKKALEALKQAKSLVEQSALDSQAKAQLQRRIDTSLAECDKYIAANRA
jgi:hypothetical protein